MKLQFIFLTFLLAAVCVTGYSQSYAFKILVNKGKNEVKTKTGWQAVKVGASLSENDEIKLVSNSYVGLVHVSGKPIELKEAKTYKVTELTKLVSGGASVVSKYTDFILSSNQSSNNKLNATGAVHRGLKDIDVFMPSETAQCIYYNTRQLMNWDTTGLKGPYTITISSAFGDEFQVLKTANGSIWIDLSSKDIQNEDYVMVNIKSTTDDRQSDDKLAFKKLSKTERTKLDALYAEVAPVASEQTAMSKYILAGFFESNNLLVDAATAYQEAILLAPDVPTYKEDYHKFLLRTELKNRPEGKK